MRPLDVSKGFAGTVVHKCFNCSDSNLRVLATVFHQRLAEVERELLLPSEAYQLRVVLDDLGKPYGVGGALFWQEGEYIVRDNKAVESLRKLYVPASHDQKGLRWAAAMFVLTTPAAKTSAVKEERRYVNFLEEP